MAEADDIDDCTGSGDSEIGFRQLDVTEKILTYIDVKYSENFISLVRVILVLLLRVGFILVQLGSVPITNVNLILSQNVIDFCWVSIVFIFLGSVISYTGDFGSTMGRFYWIGDKDVNKEEVIIGWQAVMIASAISTSCTVGRVQNIASFIIGLILCGILQPFIIHWTWTIDGWLSYNYFRNRKVMFRDYGGSTVVHMVGGLTGFVGCLILGRRLLKLQDLDRASVSTGSVATTFLGHLFISLGLQSLMISNNIKETQELITTRLPSIMINNLLSLSSCTIVVTVIHFYIHKSLDHWMMMRCTQAATAGIVIISAGVDDYSPPVALLFGCIGGVLFYLISRVLFKTSLEDYCNIVSIHVICALMGSLVAPFFHDPPRERPSLTTTVFTLLIDCLWHYISLIIIILIVILSMIPVFLFLDHYGFLRNESEVINHFRSDVVLQRIPPRSIVGRLFGIDSRTVYLQPGKLSYQDLVNVPGPSNSGQEFTVERVEIPQQTRYTRTVQNNHETVVQKGQKMKKVRQVFTISSVELGFEDAENIVEDKILIGDRNVLSSSSMIENKLMNPPNNTTCSSDALKTDFRDYYDHESRKSNILCNKTSPRTLHRVLNSMNINREKLIEQNMEIKVLVEPRSNSYVNSESEDEDNSVNKLNLLKKMSSNIVVAEV